MARVLLFGRLADVAGWRERDIPARTLAELRGRIATEDPALFEALQAPAVRTASTQSAANASSRATTIAPAAR